MMYMPDAIVLRLKLWRCRVKIKIVCHIIYQRLVFHHKVLPTKLKTSTNFEITYQPDYRQAIADSWPQSIDDSSAREDWGWQHQYGLAEMTTDMLKI